jgi:hypothetical protein
MASLLRRPNGEAEAEAEEPVVPVAAPLVESALPVQASLFLADAMLAGLAGWLALRTHGSQGWGGTALCLLALLLGAWLSCLAIWLGRPGPRRTVANQ